MGSNIIGLCTFMYHGDPTMTIRAWYLPKKLDLSMNLWSR